MMVIPETNFASILRLLKLKMLGAPPVKTERWQGVAANTDTFELQNVAIEADLRGIEHLDHWQQQISPNLPWADDHFMERVGGKVLNPGEEWKNWPWGQSASKFVGKEEYGPRMAAQDWAYLAGMIDGDGTIYYQKHKMPSFQGVVRVYQKDRAVLDYLHQLFKIGDIHETGVGVEQVLNGKTYENRSHQWAIGSVLEIRWILNGVLPYLQVKKNVAKTVLMAIDASLKADKLKTAPMKKVWGQDWPARFNHSYADRMWASHLEGGSRVIGLERPHGDLQDWVEYLADEPHNRQHCIGIWFPEDVGRGDGGRKPCSMYWQAVVRNKRLCMHYSMRSADLRRHFPDDLYMSVRLLLWALDQCRGRRKEFWQDVIPGTLFVTVTSLHIFASDHQALKEGKW